VAGAVVGVAAAGTRVRPRTSGGDPLASAAWVLRTTTYNEDALRAAVDLGGDTDTVAAVTGGLAGACYGWTR
jgi:ADP-ribosylglycohydrolase